MSPLLCVPLIVIAMQQNWLSWGGQVVMIAVVAIAPPILYGLFDELERRPPTKTMDRSPP